MLQFIAYSAYLDSTDAALLVPCNIVVTQVRPGRIKVESIRLTKMLGILSNISGRDEVVQLEKSLEAAILSLWPRKNFSVNYGQKI
ncbi:MAG: hypothetical protein Fur0010_16420 [Bdellovibrio sp.]